MRCQSVQGLFSEIYDGIAADQAILEKHIQECPICMAEYEDYCRILHELRMLPKPDLPPSFHDTIMANIRQLAQSENSVTVKPELSLYKGNKPVNKAPAQKSVPKKAYTAARRWASVAAAACLLLISMWAVQAFDLVPQSDMSYNRLTSMSYEYGAEVPQSAHDSAIMDFEPHSENWAMPAGEDIQYDLGSGYLPEDNDTGYYISAQSYQDDFVAQDEDMLGHEVGRADIVSSETIEDIDFRHLFEPLETPLMHTLDSNRAWTIAFATVFAILVLSLAAMAISIRRKI